MAVVRRHKARCANRKGIRTIAEFLADNGFEIVNVQSVGQDPGTMSVVSLVIARDASGRFAVIRLDDWTLAKEYRKKDTIPYKIRVEWEGHSREDALNAMATARAGMLANFSWFIPGTKELVPGCRSEKVIEC